MEHHAREAILAASGAGDAVAELLRFHLEGAVCNWPFGDAQPVEKLAEALLRAARIEGDILEVQPAAADYRSSLGQLAGACIKFLEDQCDGAPPHRADLPEAGVPH